jgi:hypothetical protein
MRYYNRSRPRTTKYPFGVIVHLYTRYNRLRGLLRSPSTPFKTFQIVLFITLNVFGSEGFLGL